MVSELRPRRENKDDPDHLYVGYGGKLSIRNADLARVHGIEIRGPKGPNVGQFIDFEHEEISRDEAPKADDHSTRDDEGHSRRSEPD
jgi:hypothetical protein